jgi:hypothetical protein
MLIMSSANAGFLIEPYIGYEVTGFEYDLNPVSESPMLYANKGTNVGARVGLTLGRIFIAFDYETGTESFAIDEVPPDYESYLPGDKTRKRTGIAFGIDIPIIPIRLYGKSITSATLGDIEGTGTAFGLGLTFLPWVDINIEYRSYSYEKVDMGVPLVEAQDIDVKGVMLGISIPFNL